MKIYVVKDEKVGYMNVVLDHNDEVARLNFGKGFFNAKPELGRLEDYSLYSIADFTVRGTKTGSCKFWSRNHSFQIRL
jgi:hypothetical protein